jgi:hypothetical protein
MDIKKLITPLLEHPEYWVAIAYCIGLGWFIGKCLSR